MGQLRGQYFLWREQQGKGLEVVTPRGVCSGVTPMGLVWSEEVESEASLQATMSI